MYPNSLIRLMWISLLPGEKKIHFIKQQRTKGKYAGKERESCHSIRCRQYRQEADRKVRAILMFPEHDPLTLARFMI